MEILLAFIQLIFILAAAAGLSRLVFKKDILPGKWENLALRITLGFGLLCFFTFAASAAGQLNLYFFIIVLVFGCFLFFRYGPGLSFSDLKPKNPFSLYRLPLFLALLLNLFYTLFPPTFLIP